MSPAEKEQKQRDFLNAIVVAGGPVDVAYKYLKANGKTTQTVSNSRFHSHRFLVGSSGADPFMFDLRGIQGFYALASPRPLSTLDIFNNPNQFLSGY